jgi:Domain of unknown function (DUF4365)
VKKISEQQSISQQGVHLLGARLLSLGMSFHPNGPLDAGIDGFLELRDPESGEVKAQWITAQLKTQKEGRLAEETDESFSYPRWGSGKTCEHFADRRIGRRHLRWFRAASLQQRWKGMRKRWHVLIDRIPGGIDFRAPDLRRGVTKPLQNVS